MGFKTFGLVALHEFLGDLVVYRDLVPADGRLPPLAALRDQLNLEHGALPRKSEPAYGRVVAELLRRARALDRPGTEVTHLLYIGDTHLNDGTAFRNVCAAGGWPGWAFIGRDVPGEPPQVRVEEGFYLANRWGHLPSFLAYVEDRGFALDEGTAVVVDLDKNALGARGRNDRAIDQARVEGVERTVANLLGPRFDGGAFRAAYDELNQPAYHTFTTDNQDYLAYLCLVLGAGLLDLDSLIAAIEDGRMGSFRQFITQAQDRRSELAAAGLAPVHDDVWRNVQAGDPTPFKAFRRNEYLTTAARFGDLPGAGVEEILARRITITQEVRATALALRARGALIFGVSDKPDEASVPTDAQAAAGMQPLHRLETVAVGEA
jgi:hypothetical protein